MRQFIVAFAALFALTAFGAPPHSPDLDGVGSKWRITAYNDLANNHTQLGTQILCFKQIGNAGSQTLFRWKSTTFAGWQGICHQEGDQLFCRGDYANDVGHDVFMLELVTRFRATGHWHEWRETGPFGTTIIFGNAILRNIGNCTARELRGLSSSDADIKAAEAEDVKASTGNPTDPS